MWYICDSWRSLHQTASQSPCHPTLSTILKILSKHGLCTDLLPSDPASIVVSSHEVLILCYCAGAVQGFNDTQIEGADPCISGNDPVYGSNYQVVASKPSSQSDFAVSQDPSVNCQQPIQVCGPVTFVERECRQTAGCTAFSYDGR